MKKSKLYSYLFSATTTTPLLIAPKSWNYTIAASQDMPYIADNMIDSMQLSNYLRCGLLCTSNTICQVFVYSQSTQNCSFYKQAPSQFVASLVSTSYIRN